MNFSFHRWNTPLNTLRALAVLIFVCSLISMLIPSTRQFLAVQLFSVRSLEVGPDQDDREITQLGLNS